MNHQYKLINNLDIIHCVTSLNYTAHCLDLELVITVLPVFSYDRRYEAKHASSGLL